MKEYAKNRESQFRTVESNSNGFRQPPVSEILQAYRKGTLGRSPIQRESIEEDDDLTSGQPSVSAILQQYSEKRQKYASEEDEKILQGKFDTVQRQEKPNNTSLPDSLKSRVENLSGYSMDDVKVHYNSDKPAQLNALAYAQWTDIHVAPGQEKHLPHEAWHVVQQRQGRVQPTMRMQDMSVNDNESLEKEADVMGGKVMQNISRRIGIVRNKEDLKDRSIQCLMDKMRVDETTYKKMTMSKVYLFAQTDEEELGIFATTRDKHAEENLIDYIRSHPIRGRNLTVFLSTSPCSSTFGTREDGKPGCQEKLEELEELGFTLSVRPDHLYQPSSIGVMERSIGFPAGLSSYSSAITSSFDIKFSHLPKSFHEDQLIDTGGSVAQLSPKNNNEKLEEIEG